MIYDPAFTENKHRAISAESVSLTLSRKTCSCGAQITARQAKYGGQCDSCRLIVDLLPGDFDLLQHMLGVKQTYKAKWGFRNHYLCNVQDRAAMERLVAAGLARPGERLRAYYHATKDGCRAAGLDRAGIVRAMGAIL
ncbi:MAG: hypothetical protein JO142_21330 [Burkholderiales bacterium]|nr:hypothetical protein [Burkholderiales bacterium]